MPRSPTRRWTHVLKHVPSLIYHEHPSVAVTKIKYVTQEQNLLDILNAAKSLRSFPSTPRPPNMYITLPTMAAAWPSRGEGMKPMHCNSVHFPVCMLNDQVSL